ncbi:Rv3235 family protein [Catenuloplanes atrovinosus]|uniref:Uncharacterized protein n=1 Tax=Catenuloplanes atrovinosus TaxID=137266 RepID=A0AAE3YUZ9_9ACTN|nr:Rv3235 family protein [Catenuloplanes atrovinosus]MDR7279151.1 hypothetical protein [Catenuloplanes atrovinosus]
MVTRLVDPRGTRPAIRVSRIPPVDPPFDDEPLAWSDADQLTLPWRPREPPVPDAPASLAGLRSLSDLAALAGLGAPGRTPPPIPADALAGASGEARGAAHRFLTRALEILNGYRPVGHLRASSALLATPTILRGADTALRTIARLRRAAGLPPVAGRRPLAAEARVRPRRLRVCEPRPGVAEASAVLTTAGRTWALAYRLELLHGRWLATAFTVV